MTPKKIYQVIPAMSGGWNVRTHQSLRAIKNFADKKDAEIFAKQICRKYKTDLFVHKDDGSVQYWKNYAAPLPQ
jgi:hypothetical protein